MTAVLASQQMWNRSRSAKTAVRASDRERVCSRLTTAHESEHSCGFMARHSCGFMARRDDGVVDAAGRVEPDIRVGSSPAATLA